MTKVLKLTFKLKRQDSQESSLPPNPQLKGSLWWAISLLPPAVLQTKFTEERVGGILYTAVDSVTPTDLRFLNAPVVLLRLNIPAHREEQYYMELCLSEIGIGLLEEADEEYYYGED